MDSIDDFLSKSPPARPRVCIVTSIFHGFGKIGGFGAMAKSLAMVLGEAGYDVVVVAPRRKGQAAVTEVAGFTVLGLSMRRLIDPRLYRRLGAQIYHSQSPNLMSAAAMLGARQARHVITCRDPRSLRDWWIEIRDATLRRKLRNLALMFFEEGPLVTWAIRRADCVAFAARFLEEKITRMYKPGKPLTFLPNIEDVPESVSEKSGRPTVCFVARLDRRKRPEMFLDLAREFPDVRFLMIGVAEDAARQQRLEELARDIPNLEAPGYVDKFDDEDFYGIYDGSWVFVNTASREAHPLTFFEAAGRGCAILSYVNPDDFASRFGYWAADEDFARGLRELLDNDNWRERGRLGHAYVREYYRHEVSAKTHLDLYADLIGRGAGR
ncbi:MAG: glycosyltransferase family 4 protein [Proteobacteria bacterium]|nr:glycosyltransferase family 4 protein [Pseudomonadota bacterium]